MSAPDTNLDKQKRRHWGPIFGITAALAVAGALFLTFFGSQTELFEDDAAAAVPATTASE